MLGKKSSHTLLIIAMMLAMTTAASTVTAESNEETIVDDYLDESHLLEDALLLLESVSDVEIIVVTDGNIAEVTVIVDYSNNQSEVMEFRFDLDEIREVLSDYDGEVEWESQPSPPLRPNRDCDRGFLRGTIITLENGTSEIIGVAIDQEGEIVANLWGFADSDGFASGHGSGSDSTITQGTWKAVYENGRFSGFWKSLDNNESENEGIYGKMKGHYKVNESNGTGVFHGKWKQLDCKTHAPSSVDDGDYEDSRVYWADNAYQIRGSQDDYDAVMDSEDPKEEYMRILSEMSDCEDEDIDEWIDVEENETTEEWNDEEIDNGTSEEWVEEVSEDTEDNATSENGTVIDVGSMKVLPGFTGVIGMVALMGGAVIAGRRSVVA